MLDGDFLGARHRLQPRYHLRMIANSVRQGRPASHFHVAMLLAVDGGIIGGVGDVHHQRDVRFK